MTSTIEPAKSGQILKTDRLGRIQVPADRRKALLDEFERSGMSGAQFADRYGIKYQTFASWRQRRKKTKPARRDSTPEFFLVEAPENRASEPIPRSTCGLEIDLPGGARLAIRSREEIALAVELLRALS